MYQNLFQYFMNSFGFSMFSVVVGVVFVFALYLVPFWVALGRRKKQTLAIFFLNLFAGWTGVGWLAALIWAVFIEQSDGEGKITSSD